MRAAIVVLGIVLVGFAGLVLLLGAPAQAPITAGTLGLLLLAGTLFERRYYKRLADAPPAGPGWRLTEEKFTDPASGAIVAVYYHAGTGERRYVRG